MSRVKIYVKPGWVVFAGDIYEASYICDQLVAEIFLSGASVRQEGR